MADYRLYIKQQWGSAEYGNTFNVQAADAESASVLGQVIATALAATVWEEVLFTGVRVSTRAQDGRTGRTFPLSIPGEMTFSHVLPIFNTGRIKFYPGVKQNGLVDIHFALDGDEQARGLVFSAAQARLQAVGDDIITLGSIRDTNWGLYTSAQAEGRVGMRQSYRAWSARPGADTGD